VACFDYVKPSPHGTKWGLGGTCVNVGCIPKKLMHTASIYGELIQESRYFGWTLNENVDLKKREERAKNHSWETMVNNINQYIKSINFGYLGDLAENNVKYYNAHCTFVDNHTVEATFKMGTKFEKKQRFSAKTFVLAVGGRPSLPEWVPGYEHGITSDDIFYLKKHPGKTLVVGAAYVALECAGFLNGVGCDTSVMVREFVLRGFDPECSDKITISMHRHGVRFLQPYNIKAIKKLEDGKLEVSYVHCFTKEEFSELFDTVLFAIGRYADIKPLGLEKFNIMMKDKKILTDEYQQTSVSGIYAIGDIIAGGLELTPVAIKTGKLLAQRLYNGSKKKMDFNLVPTTVFTPLEYGSVGLSEEDAIRKFGEDNIKIYKKNYYVLEYSLGPRKTLDQCFIKLICNAADNERVVGFHYCGPNAGEVTQGVGVAMRFGPTKEDFDNTVGIHPTTAEEMTGLVYGITESTSC
jgi:thioredoxin reductase (NADPH)